MKESKEKHPSQIEGDLEIKTSEEQIGRAHV